MSRGFEKTAQSPPRSAPAKLYDWLKKHVQRGQTNQNKHVGFLTNEKQLTRTLRVQCPLRTFM